MSGNLNTFVVLATFEPALADAVVAVLRGGGCPAHAVPADRTAGDAAGQRAVLVPPARRQDALALLAARMEDVHAQAAEQAARDPEDAASSEDDPARPLLLPRLRRFGSVALLLAPILVVTLAGFAMPRGYALLIVVGGIVALVAWRDRAGDDETRGV